MGLSVKNNTKVAIKEEVAEGTYQEPTSGSDFVQILADGLEVTPARETLERSILGLGLSKVVPRQGLKSVTGSLPVEMKASNVPGAAPEYDVMMKSLLGGKRLAATVTSKATGNTIDTLAIEDADIAKFKVGDTILVKEAGAYHYSPIITVDTTASSASIELLIPRASGVFAASAVIEAFTTYYGANDGHPSFSVSKYVENSINEKAIGCKATSLSVDNFSTGQIASMNIGFEGGDFDHIVDPPAFQPVYQSSLPPTILDACIYQDGVEIYVNEFTVSVENTLAFLTDTCRGKTSSRITERSVSGTINPFKQNDSVEQFDRFNTSTPFSIFIRAYNPTAVDGQKKEAICFYLPHCVFTEIGEADLDGLLQEALSFSANSEDGSSSEIFVTFI